MAYFNSFQYCPIPVVQYPQLENELFCNIYYLKHLCDVGKYPDWPIKEPVSFSVSFNVITNYLIEKSHCELSLFLLLAMTLNYR